MIRGIVFLLAFAAAKAALTSESEGGVVPSFDFAGLASQYDGGFLTVKDAAKEIGAFALSGMPEEFNQAVAGLKAEAPACFSSDPTSVERTELSGSVERLTSARASFLPKSSGHPDCLRTEVIEAAFDDIANLVQNLIAASVSEEDLEFLEDGVSKKRSFREMPYLDHVHLYQPNPSSPISVATSLPSVPYHTDNGLFLLLTPSALDQQPLIIRDSADRELIASNIQGDVIVVFGRALEQWLLQNRESERFRAGVHAVPEIKGQRVVFARMYIAPEAAMPVKNRGVTFGQIFKSDQDTGSSVVNNFCPSGGRFVHAQRQSCEAGTQYCWMSCLELDEGCPAEEQSCYDSADNGACCLEGQSEDHDGCYEMNINCEWHC